MARRTEDVIIDLEGRDKGRMFRITEMPADQAEWWAMRAWMALSKAGVVIPDSDAEQGMWAVAAAGIPALSRLSPMEAKPLLDEMWECVKFIPDPTHPLVGNRTPMAQDIEEIATRMLLRMKVLQLHIGFSPTGGPSNSAGTMAGTSPAGPPAGTSLPH